MNRFNWQAIDIRILAVVASLFISCFTFAFPEPLNDDAFLYIRTAEIFLNSGLTAAYAHYSWASYSVLIGTVSLTGLTIIQSAFLLNGLFFALLTYGFISVVKTIDSSDTTLIAAAILILVFPELNEYRHFIIRDIGFWALVFIAIWQLSLFVQQAKSAQALIFVTCLLFAASLRIEAIAYLLFVPLVLLLFIRDKEQFRRVALLNLGSALALVAVTIILLVSGINVIAMATQFVSTYLPFFRSAFSPEQEQTLHLANTLFGSYGAIYSGRYLTLFMATGFFALLIISIANALGVPLLTVLVFGLIKRLKNLQTSKVKVLLAVISVNFLIVFGFIYITRFLPSRYAMVLAISITALIPILVSQWFSVNWPQLRSWKRAGPFMIVLYLFIDSYISFGRSTDYIDNAISWLATEQLQLGQLITNESAIGYFSQVVEEYDRVSNEVFISNIKNAKQGDYIAFETRQSLMFLLEEQFTSDRFEPLAQFPERSNPRILIYRRL